ncbi:MOSC domain-containing protein [Halomonas huangheensis]|uniref:MOSC domain-containing protein n=1 Tax=Halomonas huangheensis TaxID=1178482 RepID=W1N990_9GAMM|nr:MOSC N-terminal beta barrel domain-containing protein [Halomonas huangheensis]ALM53167.1 molybdenum cofactor sulfurase [Halomonas huangheensis]ERL51480.1 hypothetical protein BJB45_13755 [Halomonas huangheensis]
MTITELNCYPVKSLKGIRLTSAELGERGLVHDRQWMLVNADGRFVTQREVPALATIGVSLNDTHMALTYPGMPDLEVSLDVRLAPPSNAERREVRVWRSDCLALDEGADAMAWLNDVLGPQGVSGLRLVRFDPQQRREVEHDYLREGEPGAVHTAFADGYPLLVTSETSLEALNRHLRGKGESEVPMTRFRPNLVVSGVDQAFIERNWQSLVGPGYRLGIRKPCKRCKIITIDQRSGETPSVKEPLRSLVELDTQPGWKGAFFGQNAIIESGVGATLRVGDVLDITTA